MGKMVECAKVDPSSGCNHVVRGQTEEEVLKNAAEHAKQHGIREVTPELRAKALTSPRKGIFSWLLRPSQNPSNPVGDTNSLTNTFPRLASQRFVVPISQGRL